MVSSLNYASKSNEYDYCNIVKCAVDDLPLHAVKLYVLKVP